MNLRIHGRGGQGAVVASLILARAAHREGRFAQSFPEFGVERRGAPVSAFLRLDEQPIRIRSKIYSPDHLMVLDPKLLSLPSTLEGLKSGGVVVVNLGSVPDEKMTGTFKSLAQPNGWTTFGVAASSIAASLGIGSPAFPVANTAMVGAFAKATGFFRLEAVLEAIEETFPKDGDKNIRAAKEAYEKTRSLD